MHHFSWDLEVKKTGFFSDTKISDTIIFNHCSAPSNQAKNDTKTRGRGLLKANYQREKSKSWTMMRLTFDFILNSNLVGFIKTNTIIHIVESAYRTIELVFAFSPVKDALMGVWLPFEVGTSLDVVAKLGTFFQRINSAISPAYYTCIITTCYSIRRTYEFFFIWIWVESRYHISQWAFVSG